MYGSATSVGDVALSHDDEKVPVMLEFFHHTSNCVRAIGVVGVEPGDHMATGLEPAFVDSIRLAFVRFAYPVGKYVSIFFYDINTSVRTASVDDNVFQVRISLEQNRSNRLFDPVTLVV